MGGTGWAESTPGEGTIFQFTIIVAPSHQLVEHNLYASQPEVAG